MFFTPFPTLTDIGRILPPDDIGFSTNRIEIGNDAREQNPHKRAYIVRYRLAVQHGSKSI